MSTTDRTHSKRLIEATCPDCRGPLTELRLDSVYEYRCLVGHRFSTRTLLAAHSEAQEVALWAAVVALEEAANIANAVAPQFSDDVAARLRAQGQKRLKQGGAIRGLLDNLEPFQPD